jgi:hypothetical protein
VAPDNKIDRAEARRRYRAYLQEQEGEAEEGADEEPAESTAEAARSTERAPRSKARSKDDEPAATAGQRVGMGQAFRMAMRPVHYVDDIRFLPTLAVRTPAIWLPALISVGALAWGLTRTDFNDGSSSLLIGLLLAGGTIGTPALIQPLVAGYFAPRASWLAGLTAGVVSALCFTILIMVWFAPDSKVANLPIGDQGRPIYDLSNVGQVLFPSLLGGITLGALLAAASAWYKRFLNLIGAANSRRTAGKPAPRKSSARR